MNDKPISPEQREALLAYARANGRYWKQRLSVEWSRASVSGTLQSLLNSHGPTWLKNVCRLKELTDR